MTVKEVSKILKVNTDKVYDLIRKGYLPALKLGSLKTPPWALKEFINQNIGNDFTDLDNIKKLEVSDGTRDHY